MLVLTTPNIFYQLQRTEMIFANKGNTVCYNLSANVTDPDFIPLNLMRPVRHFVQQYGSATCSGFDASFISSILNDEVMFMEFMQIAISLYTAKDVFIMVYNEPEIFIPAAETLMKLIQQRYGYDYEELHSVEDFDPYHSGSFNTVGAVTFDMDMARLERIIARANPGYFTNETIDETHL